MHLKPFNISIFFQQIGIHYVLPLQLAENTENTEISCTWHMPVLTIERLCIPQLSVPLQKTWQSSAKKLNREHWPFLYTALQVHSIATLEYHTGTKALWDKKTKKARTERKVRSQGKGSIEKSSPKSLGKNQDLGKAKKKERWKDQGKEKQRIEFNIRREYNAKLFIRT